MHQKSNLKLVCLFTLLCMLFAAPAWAQNEQNVTLKLKNSTLRELFSNIESQTTYRFSYRDVTIDNKKDVNVTSEATPVSKVLANVLPSKGLEYKIVSAKSIVIYPAATAVSTASKEETIKVTGRITDAAGEPIIGANVRDLGGKAVTVTNYDGDFSINVPRGSKFEVSYLGYTTESVVANGQPINVSLHESATQLDNVVVTALGIRKEAKALSYNVQEVKADELTGVKDANFINSLAGKVAGVNINTSSAGIGGGAKVVMRGAKSLSGNNNALYVIDGIPMPQLQMSQPEDMYTGMGQSGDGAAMINPEDIESMSVLSGAAASALYGSDAANGVIMITTKKGSKDGIRINYANNTSFMRPFVTPDFQNTYGATTGSFQSWGAKLQTPSSYDPLDFYKTGWNETNSLTASFGSDRNQTFLSFASTNAEGIVENNEYDRYNFTFRNSSDLFNDRLHIDLAANYINIREKNMVSEGQYFNPIVPVYLMSPSYSLDTYKLFEMYDESRGFKTQYWPWGNQGLGMQNPYWIVNRDSFINHKNRFMANGGLTYDIIKGLKASVRGKIDYTSTTAEKKYHASTDAIFAGRYGFYEKANYNTRQLYGDFMLNYDRYFGDISLTAVGGASIKDVNYEFSSVGSDLNSVANSFTLLNLNKAAAEYKDEDYHDQTQSIFGTAQVGWKSALYLDLTGRMDWASALAYTTKNHVGYGSVGLSAILTDLFPVIRNQVLSFLKIRGSYSEVGNAPARYVSFLVNPYQSGMPTDLAYYPNTQIEPERTKAWEVGLQSRLWNDKIRLDVSLYKTSTFNQLFEPALPASSGYTKMYINGGRVDNRGLELSLSVNQPLGPVDWTTTFTYTINRNKIKSLLAEQTLSDGVTTVSQDHVDLGTIGNVRSRLVEGGSIGDLWVTALATDEHGHIIVDYVNNTVSKDDNAGPYKDGWIKAGNSSPKYTMGWRNNFSWKGINVGFLVSARVGGEVVSMTQAYMDAYGVSAASAAARDAGGVIINGSKVPAAQKYFQTVGSSVGANYVYSATNVRLAELNIGYDIPVHKWVNWIQGLNVAFTGRNLWMIYNKAPFDPELTMSTDTHFSGIDYFMMPSLRNLGFSVKVNF